MKDEMTRTLRKLTHEQMHNIWETAKSGDLDILSGEDKLLAEVMLEHDEYHNQFEFADLTYDHEL